MKKTPAYSTTYFRDRARTVLQTSYPSDGGKYVFNFLDRFIRCQWKFRIRLYHKVEKRIVLIFSKEDLWRLSMELPRKIFLEERHLGGMFARWLNDPEFTVLYDEEKRKKPKHREIIPHFPHRQTTVSGTKNRWSQVNNGMGRGWRKDAAHRKSL